MIATSVPGPDYWRSLKVGGPKLHNILRFWTAHFLKPRKFSVTYHKKVYSALFELSELESIQSGAFPGFLPGGGEYLPGGG